MTTAVNTVSQADLHQFMDTPIPKLPSAAGWRDRPVREELRDDEPLRQLNEWDFRAVLLRPFYYLREIPGATPRFWVREKVLDHLHIADERAHSVGYTWIIKDTWRPEEVQQFLFEEQMKALEKEWTTNGKTLVKEIPLDGPRADRFFTRAMLVKATQKYVSLPSVDAVKPSPHLTGGAVDLILGNEHGDELPIGEFDLFHSSSGTRYYEELHENGNIQPYQVEIWTKRRLQYWLFSGPEANGRRNPDAMQNYAEEYWHEGFGDAMTAATYNVPVHYGPVWPPAWKKSWKPKIYTN